MGQTPNAPTFIDFDHRQDPYVREWRVLEGLGSRVTDVDELHIGKLAWSLIGLDCVLADRQPLQHTLGFSEAPPSLGIDAMNRPGVSGDSVPWEGWSHVSKYVQEVSAGAA